MTCFTFHPLANTTIHQACLFPASFSKGEAETQMLQGDFPQAPASSCLFAFPSSAQERSSVLSNLRAPMKAALMDLCVQGVSAAFPWKMAGVVTWGCSSPRKLTSEWNNARTALGKLVMGMDASCRGPAPWSCREMPTWCWRVTHISVFSTVEAKWLLAQPQVVELPPCAQKQLLFVYQLWKVQGNVCAGEADSPSEACRQLLCTPPKQRRWREAGCTLL